MADLTSSSNGQKPRNRAAGASLVLGLLAVAVLPAAVLITEHRSDLRLLHAGIAVPVAAVLALAAILLARRARRESALRLGRAPAREGVARAGHVFGVAGVCLALAAVVSLGVYELLQHQGGSG